MIGFTISLNRRKIKNKHKKTGKKFLYFLPVIFIMIFAICASFFVDKKDEEIKENKTNSIEVFKAIDNYSVYYLPVVMNEFFSYEKGEKIENDMLIRLGVWSILLTEDTEKYEAFDGELTLPKGDVEERIELLFSEEINIENTSAEGKNYSIRYDEETEHYVIPTQGFSPNYSGVLQSVEAKSGKTVLSVGCLKSDSFKQDSSGNTVLPEAEKKIEIVLKKKDDRFYIESIS